MEFLLLTQFSQFSLLTILYVKIESVLFGQTDRRRRNNQNVEFLNSLCDVGLWRGVAKSFFSVAELHLGMLKDFI